MYAITMIETNAQLHNLARQLATAKKTKVSCCSIYALHAIPPTHCVGMHMAWHAQGTSIKQPITNHA